MLTFKKILLTTFVFVFIVNSLNAQTGYIIDSLKLLPQDPDTSDIIKVVCFYTFPSGPCELDSFSINENNFEIYVNTYYNVGDLTYMCSSSDTINIGKLNSGNYKLIYYIKNLNTSSYDIDTIDFTVNAGNGFQVTENMKIPIKIYPNPANDIIYVPHIHNLQIQCIKLYSIKGELIKIFSPKDRILCLSGISCGMYMLYIQTNKGMLREKLIVQ